MQKESVLSVSDIVGGSLCVSYEDGEKLYQQVASKLKEECRIVLVFDGVERVTPAFFNAAIGRLYGTFDKRRIRALVTTRALSWDDEALFNAVLNAMDERRSNPPRFHRMMRNALGNAEDDE